MSDMYRGRVAMTLLDELPALAGGTIPGARLRGRAVLVVNVASKCGLAPQYEGLQRLQQRYGDRGFTVLGVPCNQFAGQEPGTAAEIGEFCSATYATTFPMTAKLDVNGVRRHALYGRLTEARDADGVAGEVQWNFEKFLVAPSGEVTARFRPAVSPDSGAVVEAIESVLP